MSELPGDSYSETDEGQLDGLLLREKKSDYSSVRRIVNSIGIFLTILFVLLSVSLGRALMFFDSYPLIEIIIQLAAYVWMLVGCILLWTRRRAGYFLVAGFFTYTMAAIVWSLFTDQRMAFGSQLIDAVAFLFPLIMLGLMGFFTQLMSGPSMRKVYGVAFNQYWIASVAGVMLFIFRAIFVL